MLDIVYTILVVSIVALCLLVLVLSWFIYNLKGELDYTVSTYERKLKRAIILNESIKIDGDVFTYKKHYDDYVFDMNGGERFYIEKIK